MIQKKIFNKCFGATRYIYNKCVDEFRKTSLSDFQKLRSTVIVSNKLLDINHKWLTSIPYDTRQLSVKEFSANIKSAFSNLKAKNIKHFSLNYKSKHDKSQTFHIDHRAIKSNKLILFPKLQKESIISDDIKCLKQYFKSNPCDFRIQMISGKYFILLPKTVVSKNIPKTQKIVALDPGVRTFQTFYSPDGIVGKINPTEKFEKNKNKLDKLLNLSNELKCKLKNKIRKLRTKIKNQITDLHWYFIKYLCTNFDTILLPKFQTKQMISRSGKRKINKTTVNNMVSLNHFTFQTRLIYKAKCFKKTVEIVDESYTSKKCGVCKFLHHTLGGNKIFDCPNCYTIIDRDFNGSRNIFFKKYYKLISLL